MWCDYNTFREPSLTFEAVDHLPYPAPQVGYYRWMYDKDPGHQLAALGPVPPPVCVVPQIVPPGDNPFEYQVAFPNAIPNQTDPLWAEGLPEPINVQLPEPGKASNASKPMGKEPPPGMLTVPMAPVLPPAGGDKRTAPAAAPNSPNRGIQPSVEPPGSPLPGFESAPPPPRPVDEDVPPILGPASETNPNVKLTTGVPAAQPQTAAEALWPR